MENNLTEIMLIIREKMEKEFMQTKAMIEEQQADAYKLGIFFPAHLGRWRDSKTGLLWRYGAIDWEDYFDLKLK